MEAKKRAIRAAYGDTWEKVKDFVGENGKCYGDRLSTASMPPEKSGFAGEIEFCGPISRHDYWRPKSLSGIEDNNEWVRCDERLPDKLGDYYVCINGEFDGQILHTNEIRQMFERFPDHSKPSHWRPVEEVKPPIY